MNKLVLFCVFVTLIAVASAQWNQPGFQPFPQQPNINDLCNQPEQTATFKVVLLRNHPTLIIVEIHKSFKKFAMIGDVMNVD